MTSLAKLESLSNPLLLQAVRTAIQKKTAAEARDPVRLAERAGFTLDPWQCDLLRSRARQLILNCSRQSGKSTASALLALHTALYHEGALVLLLAPALRQSVELFRKLKAAINSLPSLPTQIVEESALRLEFDNGARVISLPGKEQTIRSFSSVAMLIVDEASRVPDELFAAVRPMLAVSQGRTVYLSTPWGRRGHFWQMWDEGGPDWHRVRVTAAQCPRISAEWLEAERQSIGDHWFRSEYLCEFIDALDSVFSSDDIERALSDEVKPLFL